jgi:predicted CoA-substrate-specific enzyme activase
MNTLGIDLGSRHVKVCRMSEDAPATLRVFDTMTFYREYGVTCGDGFAVDIGRLGEETDAVVATGYGRMAAAIRGAVSISEITAHTLGAIRMTGLDTFTLLDMGGQDYKIVRIAGGVVEDFATNDKCAASTGRYLENMARVLGITLEELGRHSSDPAPLSDTCAIFGESELIGLIVRGIPLPRLAAGVNATVVRRVLPFLDRMGDGTIVMSGGVALNPAVVTLLRATTGQTIVIAPEPLHIGAIGCCVRAEKKA